MPSAAEKRKGKRATLPEPKAKKARIDTSSKEKSEKEEKGKKRSRPVTAPVHEESEASEEEYDGEEILEDEPEEGDEGEEIGEGDEEGTQGKVKDPNGASHLAIFRTVYSANLRCSGPRVPQSAESSAHATQNIEAAQRAAHRGETRLVARTAEELVQG